MSERRLSKAEREALRAMFDGRCAYCGGQLGTRWHADHIEPIIRRAWVGQPPERPENHRIENMFPACAPCNISKASMPLESWREWLAGHVRSLNAHHSIYRLVKSFGLVIETGAPIVFHFENQNKT
jgi:hypothetical protein